MPPGIQAGDVAPRYPVYFSLENLRVAHAGDLLGDLVLERENRLGVEVHLVGLLPELVPVSIGQASADSEPVAPAADGSGHEVARAKLARDLLDGQPLVPQRKAGMPRYHRDGAILLQTFDDLVGQSVGERAILGVAVVVERQHGYPWLPGKRGHGEARVGRCSNRFGHDHPDQGNGGEGG